MQRGEAAPGDTAAHRAIRIREKRKKILPAILRRWRHEPASPGHRHRGLRGGRRGRAGSGVVLGDGRAYAIRWSRPAADGGTTFTTAQGQPMTFARGPVWVVLAPRP